MSKVHRFPSNQRAFTLIELMIVILIIGILAGILVPNYMRIRSKGYLTGCDQTEKSTATALEMYAADNTCRYPTSLSAIVPAYLKTLPTCPSINSDSYSPSFLSQSNPDIYTIVCGTLAHSGAGLITPNYPQFSSIKGLIERP